jgi:hypothetical protein
VHDVDGSMEGREQLLEPSVDDDLPLALVGRVVVSTGIARRPARLMLVSIRHPCRFETPGPWR